jgi:exopolysaccharide biosynthesis polyprenyl glycosylphosphotransferase
MNERTLERAILLQHGVVVALSLWLSHLLREWLAGLLPVLKPTVPRAEYIPLLVAFLPVWLWCADRMELNRVRVVAGTWLELAQTLVWTQASAVSALALLLVAAQAPLNRSYFAAYIVVSTAALFLGLSLQRPWVARERGQTVSLVVGETATAAAEELTRYRGRRVERLASVDAESLAARLQEGGVDEVVLPGDMRHEVLRPLVLACHEVGVEALVRAQRISETGGLPTSQVIGAALYVSYPVREPNRPSLMVKAIADRLAATAGTLVLMPLLLALALLVKLTSRGPALFVQQRGGLQGRPFPMLKFRTMRVGAEAERAQLLALNEMDGPVFKLRDDPRVTRVGRVLRRTSLDELPQLINVVAGHMSLVGPRPLPLVETQALTGGRRRRLSMKPGITGLWQVSGRNQLGFEDWMALDLEYVDGWSLGLDVAILLRTLPAIFSARGAR